MPYVACYEVLRGVTLTQNLIMSENLTESVNLSSLIQSPLKYVLTLQSGNSPLAPDSNTEDEVRIGLEKINLHSESDSHS